MGLSNIFTSLGKAKEVDMVKALLKRGVKRNDSFTVIEAKLRCISSWFAGDKAGRLGQIT
jgi:hypothetical protein